MLPRVQITVSRSIKDIVDSVDSVFIINSETYRDHTVYTKKIKKHVFVSDSRDY